jgi:Flp pilus assembly protein TadG
MTRLLLKRLRDERGAAMIEFAISIPVLTLFMWGIFQFGMILEAQAGMQHALGEAARYATIYPTPTDTQIQAKITSSKFGLANGTWSTPTIDNTHAGSPDYYKVITVQYSQPTNFIFFAGPTITFTKSKRIYLSV